VVSDSTGDVDTDLGLDGATRYEASVMPDRPPSVPDIVRQRGSYVGGSPHRTHADLSDLGQGGNGGPLGSCRDNAAVGCPGG
jgi:hypothetical protein